MPRQQMGKGQVGQGGVSSPSISLPLCWLCIKKERMKERGGWGYIGVQAGNPQFPPTMDLPKKTN